jgi:hypothetical protein
MCASFRTALRLILAARRVQFCASTEQSPGFLNAVTTAVHRFQESIGGRSYLIEVASVAADRWRAYIVRLPGLPTALMPFYGPTPDEAARHLRDWLTRAHERARNGRCPQ